MLLTEEDPSPVRVLREAGASDLFLTADHAGRAIPKALGDLGVSDGRDAAPYRLGHRHRRRSPNICRRLLDATAVLQTYSRLVIDCNRAPSWPSAMPEISEYTPIPGNIGLSQQDRDARVAAIFTPYHARIPACSMPETARTDAPS